MSKTRTSFALLVGCAFALGLGGTAASAADMGLPSKAPPAPAAAAPPPIDIHGFVDAQWENELVNPNGMALSGGSETIAAGLNLTLYKNKAGFINSWSIGGTTVADFTQQFQGYWTPGITQVPGCCETANMNGDAFDWAWIANTSVTFGTYWSLTESYIQAYSLDVGPTPALSGFNAFAFSTGFPTLRINELKLGLNDSFTGWWITFNPYVTWAYYLTSLGSGAACPPGAHACNAAGFAPGAVSGIGFEGETNASNFFVGITPTTSLMKWGWNIPVTLKAPTYVTVGPSSSWNALCGNTAAVAVLGITGNGSLACSSGDVGIFTTGLTAIWDLTWLPPQWGHWYVKGGFQWYDLVNNAVRAANTLSVGPNVCTALGHTSACSTAFGSAPSDIVVGFVGLGVGF
ncbi:MAG TPA: hypothetical protein VK430_02395 [Xanthobacteraceae bacterium]|nr:hypothetical protein [Xanthobacteraceae bacterium]